MRLVVALRPVVPTVIAPRAATPPTGDALAIDLA